MLAWHFVGKALRNGDPIPPDGEDLVYNGEVRICRSGLHASENILDALKYAPGETLCRVDCLQIVDKQSDKLVCRRRKILWRIDSTAALRAFSRHEALSVVHLWEASDVVLDYLKRGNEKIRAAAQAAVGDTAWNTARAAACAAAWAATQAAARYGALNAALNAARAAVWKADRAATWEADRYAREVALVDASKTLESIIEDARKGIERWEWEI